MNTRVLRRTAFFVLIIVTLLAAPIIACAAPEDDAEGQSATLPADDGYPNTEKPDASIDNTVSDKEDAKKDDEKAETPAAPIALTNIKITVKEYSTEDMLLSSHDIMVGTDLQLAVSFEPENAARPSALWASSNPDVVSVTSKGLATALAEGEATITVSAGTLADTIIFKVTPKPMTTLTTTLLVGFGALVVLIIGFVTIMALRITRRRRLEREAETTRSIAADRLKRKIEKQNAQKAEQQRRVFQSSGEVDRRTRVFMPPAPSEPRENSGEVRERSEPGLFDDILNGKAAGENKPSDEEKGYEDGPDRRFSLDDV